MKSTLLEQIRTELRTRFRVISRAAMDAHAAATDPGSKAEGKYDTRSLEASYLATGQARQVEELADAIRVFDSLELPDFGISEPIGPGALVEVEQGNEISWFLLAPASGGLVVRHDGRDVTLLAPASPLYQSLLGMKVGETLENPALMVTEVA